MLSQEKIKREFMARIITDEKPVTGQLKKPLTLEATYEANIKAQVARLQLKKGAKGDKNKRMEVKLNKIIDDGVLFDEDDDEEEGNEEWNKLDESDA